MTKLHRIRCSPVVILLGDKPKFTGYQMRPDGTWGTSANDSGGLPPAEFSAFLRARYK